MKNIKKQLKRHYAGEVIGGCTLVSSLGNGRWISTCNQYGHTNERPLRILAAKGCSICNGTGRVSKYQPGQVHNGRVLVERVSGIQWKMRCVECHEEYERAISTLRHSKCQCQTASIRAERAAQRKLTDYSNKKIRTFLIHPLDQSQRANKSASYNWTGTCQNCGEKRTGSIKLFFDVGCSGCDRKKEQNLLVRQRINYTEGMNAVQRAAYQRYRRCQYSEREARAAALGVR